MMKLKILAAFGAVSVLLLLATGCVDTVAGGKTGGLPFVKDKFENRYQKPPELVFQAAKQVIRDDGILTNAGINYEQTNEVKVVTGRVNECTVWVRIAPVDAKVTDVTVQARNGGGGSNVDLIHQIATEIAVKLADR